jgi:hypothetical protein
MSSLVDLPELVGFFSYSRQDDEDAKGRLSDLRDCIERELRGQLGRSKSRLRLWQDKEAIPPGNLWEAAIKAAVNEAVFFIPIVTPTAVRSSQCKVEFEAFLEREAALGRNDLIFPILYIRVPALEVDQEWRSHPILTVIGLRQYVDWRGFRHVDVNSTEVKKQVDWFCEKIVAALSQPGATLERIAELANWDLIKSSENSQTFRDHLARFPKGATEDMARTKLEVLVWAGLAAPVNARALRGFLQEFPNGAHAREANSKLAELKRQTAAAREAEERQKRETEAWASASAAAITAFQAFLNEWPNSNHANMARTWIQGMKEPAATASIQEMKEPAAAASIQEMKEPLPRPVDVSSPLGQRASEPRKPEERKRGQTEAQALIKAVVSRFRRPT